MFCQVPSKKLMSLTWLIRGQFHLTYRDYQAHLTYLLTQSTGKTFVLTPLLPDSFNYKNDFSTPNKQIPIQ